MPLGLILLLQDLTLLCVRFIKGVQSNVISIISYITVSRIKENFVKNVLLNHNCLLKISYVVPKVFNMSRLHLIP